MWKALSIVLAVTTVLFAGLYLSRPADQETGRPAPVAAPPAAKPSADEEYVLVGVSVGNAYWIDSRAGVEDVGRDLGVKTTFTGPQGSDAKEQVDIIEAAISRGVKGIVVSPAEPEGVVPVINRAVAAGIPVITVDTDSPNSQRYTFIGTGNYEAGVIGGNLLAQELGGKGEVALLTIPGQWNLEERCRGYRDAFQSHPEIQIVAVGDDRADEGQATSQAKSMLQAHPGIKGFGCVDAAGGVGAAVAVRDADKKGQVKIVAMDRNDATLDFIKSGTIQASLAQRTYTMAYLAIQMLYDLQRGRIMMVKDWKTAGVCPLPASVNTGTVTITIENVDQFYHK